MVPSVRLISSSGLEIRWIQDDGTQSMADTGYVFTSTSPLVHDTVRTIL
jgi:hypothetical protein